MLNEAFVLGERLGYAGSELQTFVNDLFGAERQRRADEREEAKAQRDEAKPNVKRLKLSGNFGKRCSTRNWN